MYICLLPQNQLLCRQVSMIAMQLYNIAIHILNLIRIERGLGREPGPRTSKISTSYRNPLYIDVCLSASSQPALFPASRYNYDVAVPYSNTHTNFN